MLLKPRRGYVISRRLDKRHPQVVAACRGVGHLIHDYREGDFRWEDIDPSCAAWRADDYVTALRASIASRKFKSNAGALHWCDTVILIMPAGHEAGIELGFGAAAGKHCIVLIDPAHVGPPSLMHGFADDFVDSIDALLAVLARPLPRKIRERVTPDEVIHGTV